MKRKIVIFCVLLLMTFSLYGCGNQEDISESSTNVDNKLVVWVSGDELLFAQEMCNLFLEEYGYEDLEIQCVEMSEEDAIYTLTYDWEKAADVLLYSSGDSRNIIDAGLLLPITLKDDELKNQYDSKAYNACSYDGLLYGIPIEPNVSIMYYNKNIFDKEDVRSVEGMLSRNTSVTYNFSYQISYYLEAFFNAMDCNLFGEDGNQPNQCTWNNADGYKVSKYILDLLKNPLYYENIDGDAVELFKNGEIGAICLSSYYALELKEALGENLGAVKLPVINIDGKERQLSDFIEYSGYGVNAYTQHPKEAQELVQWLGGELCQMKRYELYGAIPTLTELYQNDVLSKDDVVSAVVEQSKHSVVMPTISQMTLYWDVAFDLGEAMVTGDITEDNLQHYLDLAVENITFKLVQ